MYLLGKIRIKAVLPEKFKRLEDIAYNFWWSWNPEAIDIFKEIDSELWEKTGKNPVRFIQEIDQNKLELKMRDSQFMDRYNSVVNKFDSYLANENTWFNKNFPDKKHHMVAYFSAEYGLNEVLPIYSGGLGILSGDHCKSASDLGIPFTAIGLLYKQGYFSQRINREGWQETSYFNLNVSQLPIRPVLGENGEQLYISIELPGRVVQALIWEVKVGRISIYLMDTDTEKNSDRDRWLTARLYGGDQETRIQQEIFLGIGGMKVLDILNIKPTIYHMNEGHSAFMGLELIRKLVQEKGLSFKAAKQAASFSTIFTTHTPVPAGNDVFPLHMIDKYFSNFWGLLGISRHEFLDLGLKVGDNQNFNMTVLALTLSGRKNGVSELHGAVTRNIFNELWPGIPEDEVPVTHITNGIHTFTWLSPEFRKLYNKYFDEGWENYICKKETWEKVDNIPDEEIWNAHCLLKERMINYVRAKLKKQRKSNGKPIERINEVDNLLDPHALTIGFARRFATYKRANLIFRNIERIRKIINNPDMPVQIIFAGKAHPADRPAHEIIKNISDISQQEGFAGKVVLIENYNITLSRYLVQGVDIWLNNPRRPLEASGTSGQKVCINGIINFSVLDGWWCEGYNGNNGWTIGSDFFYENDYLQDNDDSESIYDILEKQIIPLYYDRNERNVPEKWVSIMKESIKSVSYYFNTNRMVKEYTNKMYVPSMEKVDKMISSNYSYAEELSEWKQFIEKNWSQVQIISEKTMNELKEYKSISGVPVKLTTTVQLGNIDPSNVKVQVYYGTVGENNIIENPNIAEMKLIEKQESGVYRYSADIIFTEGGEYGYTFRVIPYHPELISPFEMGLIRWAVQ
ncbi:MAG TPA: glycosyltransferase family 1 protein [Clostridiaceae bacterium]|nr:glycosyltransferase family 1 protein [Clostridiaceae bacterium]